MPSLPSAVQPSDVNGAIGGKTKLLSFDQIWVWYGEGPCRLFVSKGGENAASAFVGPALPDFMMAQIRRRECLDLHLIQGSKLFFPATEIEHDHCR